MLVQRFDVIYSSIVGKSRLKSIFRLSVRTIANIVLPIVFCLKTKVYKNGLDKRGLDKTEGRIIVSLTSFPARIGKLWMVINSMLRQTVKPNKIVLYLSKHQFQGGLESLPKKLRRYNELGLVGIFFVDDDLRSHKKYYYSFKDYKDDLVIIIDDDIFYPENTIEDLLKLHRIYPNCICCKRAYKIERNIDKSIGLYKGWKLLKEKAGPSFDVFHTSGGGTLYQPKLFKKDLFDSSVFKEFCFYADDVWLNFQAYRSGIPVVKSVGYSEILPVMQWKDVSLKKINVYDGGNDKQLKALINYYNVNEIDFFK